MKYKVMIVEDQTMPRELFELRIQASEHFEVALSIDNAALADVYCLRLPVDLILMDVVTRGGESGLDAAARIKRAFPADQNHHRDLDAGMLVSKPRAGDRRGELLVQGGAAREPAGRDGAHDGGRIRLSGRDAGAAD